MDDDQYVPITIELPQNIYDELLFLSHQQAKTISQVIVDRLKKSFAVNDQPGYPDYPLGPAPGWNQHDRNK